MKLEKSKEAALYAAVPVFGFLIFLLVVWYRKTEPIIIEFFHPFWLELNDPNKGNLLLWFLHFLPLVNFILLCVIVLMILGFNIYKYIVYCGRKDPVETKGTSLDVSNYLHYRPFRTLEERFTNVTESDIAEYAAALYARCQRADNEQSYAGLQDYCTDGFYKTLSSASHESTVMTVQETKPYAWTNDSESATVVVKLVAVDMTSNNRKPVEYDVFLKRDIAVNETRYRPHNCPYCGMATDFEMYDNVCPACDKKLIKELIVWKLDGLTEIVKR